MYGSLFYVLPILAVIAKTVFRAVLPLLIGCMIAYVVNILMCFYEKGYARICRMAAIAPLQRPLLVYSYYIILVQLLSIYNLYFFPFSCAFFDFIHTLLLQLYSFFSHSIY